MISGFLPLYKPSGPTSTYVLRKLSKLIGLRRMGHSGTLDPAAEGLLVVAMDRTTVVLPYLPSTKAYKAQITLGRVTDTWDAQGRVLDEKPVPALTLEQVASALVPFNGVVQQTPPPYSALWHEGQRLYDLARKGKAVQKPPRAVTLYEVQLLGYQAPVLELTVRCSPGTYIRSIAMELGQVLGCGAHLSHLLRTECGGFTVDQAVTLEQVAQELEHGAWQRHLRPPTQAVQHLPTITVNEQDALRIYHGVQVPWEITPEASPQGWTCVLDEAGTLLAVVTFEQGHLRMERVFHWDQ